MRLMLLGAPGVGKGSQATRIAKSLSIPHISTGDIFRFHISQGTELGMKARQYMEKGLLVPDEVTVEIVADRLKEEDCVTGFVLDGFPRTTQQAKFLDGALSEMNTQLDMIVNIVLDDEKIVSRLTGRRVCPSCNEVYHVTDKPPAVEGICDKCNSPIVIRSDDNEKTVRDRLMVYHNQTAPLIDFYQNRVKMVNIESNESFAVTTKMVFEAIGIERQE